MSRFIELPWALALVVLLPLLGLLILRIERRSRAVRLTRLGTRAMLVRLAPLGARLGPGRTARITAAFIFIGFAFAGPRWGVGTVDARSTGVDVVLALDASLSMLAEDVKPSRLEAMKNVALQLRAQSPNDRFALIAFAGHSYILSPLTTDQSALDLYLTNLDPTTVGIGGSTMSDAIKQATTLLSSRREDKSRVIVLMSDGETFEQQADLTAEAKRAGQAGIKLITVGFGTMGGSTIPLKDDNGNVHMKLDSAGHEVVTKYTPFFLGLAARTASNGVFIPAEAIDKAEQIRRMINRITLERRTVEIGTNLAPQFQWFVLIALLLLFVETIVTLRPRRRRVAVTATAAAMALSTAACERPVTRYAQALPRHAANIVTRYNMGSTGRPGQQLSKL